MRPLRHRHHTGNPREPGMYGATPIINARLERTRSTTSPQPPHTVGAYRRVRGHGATPGMTTPPRLGHPKATWRTKVNTLNRSQRLIDRPAPPQPFDTASRLPEDGGTTHRRRVTPRQYYRRRLSPPGDVERSDHSASFPIHTRRQYDSHRHASDPAPPPPRYKQQQSHLCSDLYALAR